MVPLQRLATVAGDQGAPQFLQLLREWEAARKVTARQVSEGDEGEERGGSREE